MTKANKHKTKVQRIAKRLELRAFTLLELLLVIAIISVLAGIIIFALKPADRINTANDAKAVANIKDFEKALKAYILDNGGNVPTGFSSITQSGIYDVCKYGETTGCVNLDGLITSRYLGNIPVDTRNSTTFTSGYKVDYNVTNKNLSVYSQELYIQKVAYCPPGDICSSPVREWLLDQSSGLTALETSGNSQGTLINGPTWVDGKTGKALSFDGIDDYVNTDYKVQAGRRSYFFWVKYNNLTGLGGYSLSGTQEIGAYTYSGIANGGQGYFYAGNSGGTYNYSFATNQWYHVGFTMDGVNTTKLYVNGRQVDTKTYSADNTATTNFLIGKVAAGHNISGLIDQIRVYNYTRTPAQIAWEYNQGLPILQWKFDETSGTIASDSSGSGNDGTLVGGPVWTAGKYGNALSFDGVDDYVIKNSFSTFPSTAITTTFWVKTTDSNDGITSYASSGGDNDWLIFSSNNISIYRGNNISSGIPFNDNNWQHLAASRDSATGVYRLYKNGIEVSTGTIGIGSNITPNGAFVVAQEQDGIGTAFDLSQAFLGYIDDVRIYNYVLTQSQIMQVMQGN